MTQVMQQQVQSVPAAGSMPTGGRWGWYRDHEGTERRRVSKLVKYVETDTYNLDQWMKRQVGEGLAIRDDLVLALKAMGRPHPVEGWSKEDKKKINGIVKEAMDAAKQANGARTGTAMHDLTERLDRGEDIESVVRGLPAKPAQSLRAYAFLRRANGWRSIEIERTVDLPELEVRGTFDRVDEIPGLSALLGPGACQYGDECPDVGLPGHGDAVIVDVKTETAPWLNGMHICPQLGIYSRAKRMWRPLPGTVRVRFSASGDEVDVQNGEYVRMPCVRQDVGIVVHVLDGDAVPYFVNLIEGWAAAVAAYEQASREARSKRSLGAEGAWFVQMPNVARPAPAQMVTEHAVAADYANPNRERLVGRDVIAGKAPSDVGDTLYAGAEGTWEAHRDADGMVRWHRVDLDAAAAQGAALAAAVAPEHKVGDVVTVGGTQFVKHAEMPTVEQATQSGWVDEVDRQAIEAVWAAAELADLAETFRIYTEVIGRQWGGRVAEAAEARRRQIECVQRQLHRPVGSATVKCACGWTSAVPA